MPTRANTYRPVTKELLFCRDSTVHVWAKLSSSVHCSASTKHTISTTKSTNQYQSQLFGFVLGSAGTCVVTPSEALLWTDGRYFSQAKRQFFGPVTLTSKGFAYKCTIQRAQYDSNCIKTTDKPVLSSLITSRGAFSNLEIALMRRALQQMIDSAPDDYRSGR